MTHAGDKLDIRLEADQRFANQQRAAREALACVALAMRDRLTGLIGDLGWLPDETAQLVTKVNAQHIERANAMVAEAFCPSTVSSVVSEVVRATGNYQMNDFLTICEELENIGRAP